MMADDLHQAIQAARYAALTGAWRLHGRSHADLAEAGVRAAWPLFQDLRDQHADLQVHAAKLGEWIKAKLASPHEDGEDGHRDGFCRRCADLYADGMALLTTDPPAAGRAILDQVERLRSALERTRDNFVRAVRGQPVRDMAETLAEVEAALDLEAAPEETPR